MDRWKEYFRYLFNTQNGFHMEETAKVERIIKITQKKVESFERNGEWEGIRTDRRRVTY